LFPSDVSQMVTIQETLFPVAMFPEGGKIRGYICNIAGFTKSKIRQSTTFHFFVINNYLRLLSMTVIIINDCILGEPSARLSQSLDGSLSSRYATSRELITSPPPPRASSVHSLPPDLLVNTLDLKRTLRRWSQDKEQVGSEDTWPSTILVLIIHE
jgi:hypothetical protein